MTATTIPMVRYRPRRALPSTGSVCCARARNVSVFRLGSTYSSDMGKTLAGTRNSLVHVRVRVVRWRHECLFDHPRRQPAHQVLPRTRLVVGTRGPRTAERLLAHHGT